MGSDAIDTDGEELSAVMIEQPKKDENATKEMKLKLPVAIHIRLHSIKVLHGHQISDVVRIALERYFASQPEVAGLPELAAAPSAHAQEEA